MAALHPKRIDRSAFTAKDIVTEIWAGLGLPSTALEQLSLPGDDDSPTLPSSFRIGHLAQSSIALSALAATQVQAPGGEADSAALAVTKAKVDVEVDRIDAVVEFQSERLYTLDGQLPLPVWGPLGGLHPTSDGYIRIHDSFPHHRSGMLALLDLPLDGTATREDVSARTCRWTAVALESAAINRGLAAYAVRTYSQWDALPQARALADLPVQIERVSASPASPASPEILGSNKREPTVPRGLPLATPLGCLRGIRVLELSRVIAAPVAGRTLAVHGADVLWVTAPHLPDLPALDHDLARGKRTVQLDLRDPAGRDRLLSLARSCDVFLQGYRPGSLAALTGGALSAEQLAAANPGIVCANLSAFGPSGPWAGRRGFDSLVQACSGMNVSEAEHWADGNGDDDNDQTPRPMPCQALDHAAGYLLAAGIAAAIYRRRADDREGRNATAAAYRVDVSLAAVMIYLRSLSQYPGRTGFDSPGCDDAYYITPERVPAAHLEEQFSGFGTLRAVRHSAKIDGRTPTWNIMPKPLGSDEPEWL